MIPCRKATAFPPGGPIGPNRRRQRAYGEAANACDQRFVVTERGRGVHRRRAEFGDGDRAHGTVEFGKAFVLGELDWRSIAAM